MRLSRRGLLLAGAGLFVGCRPGTHALPRPASTGKTPLVRPAFAESGIVVQSGDTTAHSAVVWAKATNHPGGRLVVDVTRAGDPEFANARRFQGSLASSETDRTARALVEGLDPGTEWLFRAGFGDAPRPDRMAYGRTRTAPDDDRDVRLAWSGDTVGQGWGIDVSRGGLATYRALHEAKPHAFLHVGDMIYADGVIEPEVRLDDGSVWRNLVTPAKRKVAETLDDFRGNFAYSFECDTFRSCAAEVPLYAMWDDHEVANDFWPGRVLEDPRFHEKRCDVLVPNALRAMREYVPFRESKTLYRSVSWGRAAEVFVTDTRSYRSPDGLDRETASDAARSALWGDEQVEWLVRGLVASRARWKIVTLGMPLALVLPHTYAGEASTQDGLGQGEGPPLGRELELVRVLSACRAAGVANVLFLSADVHYAAVHRFDPSRAVYKDFAGFHEAVAGPLHASSFPTKALDPTFGPEVLFQVEEPRSSGSGPVAGRQSYGVVEIAKGTHELAIRVYSGTGAELHVTRLVPQRA